MMGVYQYDILHHACTRYEAPVDGDFILGIHRLHWQYLKLNGNSETEKYNIDHFMSGLLQGAALEDHLDAIAGTKCSDTSSKVTAAT